MIVFNSLKTQTTQVIDLQTRTSRALLPHTVDGMSWSPDSSMIAYTLSPVFGATDLFVVNVEDSERRRLLSTPFPDSQPAWSPRGDAIAFVIDRGHKGGEDIYRVQSDGSDLQRLTDDPDSDNRPQWSPDGRYIAFSTSRHDTLAPDGEGPYTSEIYRMDADGGHEVRLTHNGLRKDMPLWSPDGSWVAYIQSCDDDVCISDSEIVLVSPDGTRNRTLTSDEDSQSAFAWAPSGRRMITLTRLDHGRRSALLTINLGGSSERISSASRRPEEIDW